AAGSGSVIRDRPRFPFFRGETWSVPDFWLLSLELCRTDPLHARALHFLPGTRERAVEVDGAARVLDDGGVEPGGARVEGGPRNAEVGGQPAHVELVELAFPEIAGEAGGGRAIGLEKCRVAVDARMVALADHQVCFRKVQLEMKSSTGGSLHAVV